MNYGQALTMMKAGKIVESGQSYYKIYQGKIIALNSIGLSVWLPVELTDITSLIFTEYRGTK